MTDAGSARVDPNNLFRVCLRSARTATEGSGAEGLMMPEGRRQAGWGFVGEAESVRLPILVPLHSAAVRPVPLLSKLHILRSRPSA